MLSEDTTLATRFTGTDLQTVQPPSPEAHRSTMTTYTLSSSNGPETDIRAEQSVWSKKWLMSFYTISKRGKISKRFQWETGLQTSTASQARIFTLGHPFFARELEIACRSSSSCLPSYTLSMPPIIDYGPWPWNDNPIARELSDVFHEDDVTKLQAMISSGRITLNTKLRESCTSSWEKDTALSLFDVSAVPNFKEQCLMWYSMDFSSEQ